MKKILSVIIPAYNCEDTIIKLIKSIENQGLKNYEIIIVDDGSKDNTLNIIKEYSKEKRYIQIFSKLNEGAPKARNFGLTYATGKYIFFCDADDILCEEKGLKRLIDVGESNYLDIVIGNHYAKSDKRKKTFHAVTKKMEKLGDEKYYFCDPIPGNKIYRHSFLLTHGLIFDDVKIGQDLNFFIKCVASTRRIGYVPVNVYIYNNMLSGISRTYKKDILSEIKKSIDLIEVYCVNNRLYSTEMSQIILCLRLCNYTWQLKKKCHMNQKDFFELKKFLLKDFSIAPIAKLKYFRFLKTIIIEYVAIKYLNLVIRKI